MLLLEGYISNFTRARYYFLCVDFSDFYVNQSLTGQTLPVPISLRIKFNICKIVKLLFIRNIFIRYNKIN
jgi:hypothetical protein